MEKFNATAIGLDIEAQKSVKITIKEDGTRDVNIIGLREPEECEAFCIWDNYRQFRKGDKTVRSGSGLCGVYEFDPKHPIMPNYVESDTVHSATAEDLARNILEFYPHLFDESEQKRILNLLHYHDLGEKIDNPDDGSKDRDEKFEEELQTFMHRVKRKSRYAQEQLIHDFYIFEHAGMEGWREEDGRAMRFAKLCDKTDAPLGALLYELQDRPGSLKYKAENFGGITGQDQRFIDETGDYSQAGVWTAHFIDTYLCFEDIDIFIEILIEACKAVRGKVFDWMYDFCKKRHVSEELLQKMLN